MERVSHIIESLNDTDESLNLKRKEDDRSLEPNTNNPTELPAAANIENDWSELFSSLRPLETSPQTLDSNKNQVKFASKDVVISSSMDADCGMVEELTVKNYKSEDIREKVPVRRKGQWQYLYQLAGGFRNENLHQNLVLKKIEESGNSKNQVHPSLGYPGHDINSETLINNTEWAPSDKRSTRYLEETGIRTRVLPALGFPQYVVKNTLKGKGIIHQLSDSHNGHAAVSKIKGKNISCDVEISSNAIQDNEVKVDVGVCSNVACGQEVKIDDSILGGISLREWLKPRRRKVNKFESLHIFNQILQLVHASHSEGFILEDMLPSSFRILPSQQVKYVGSFVPHREGRLTEGVKNQDDRSMDSYFRSKRHMDQNLNTSDHLLLKRKKQSETMKLHDTNTKWNFLTQNKLKEDPFNKSDIVKEHNNSIGVAIPSILSTDLQRGMSEDSRMEWEWYTSPESHHIQACTCSSNIYCLGILLFELLCCFDTWEIYASIMSDLSHRILPPNFLSENPKEAGFCLWLLHPDPSLRPKASEILKSDLISELHSSSSAIDEEHDDSEILLHFLMSIKEEKQKDASRLAQNIGCLEADMIEVEKRYPSRDKIIQDNINEIRKYLVRDPFHAEAHSNLPLPQKSEARLMKNMSQLESAYFSMRSKIELPNSDVSTRVDTDVLNSKDRISLPKSESEIICSKNSTDSLGIFFDGLCKYARYSKFEACGILRNGDLLNSASVICSLSFDRDEEYFAAAGISKKIKIFEFNPILNSSVEIHYPVIEMSSRSKLSCVCWNSYIKNYLASTDYEGVVKLWDVSTGQGFSQYAEHQQRAWSVDFSKVDPTRLASGSDDYSVKIWSIKERKSTGMIKCVANVCCVQFSSQSSHLLSLGSSDYRIYCYDLRNTRIPWCILGGHSNAVSYVKFLDSETLVSASTDNTLRIWDLNKTSSLGLSPNACSLTLRGHTNEKNFVGLSVFDGYIACGSENNEVYSYYRSLPMPITSYKFGSIDSITGQETRDSNGQFVSSVCWRERSNMVLAANSSGNIKLLQMI